MALKTRNKVEPTFNLSSLADIIFLLLIFFMLTSQLVPKATPVDVPTSTRQTNVSPDATITVTSDLRYLVNGSPVGTVEGLRGAMRTVLAGKHEPMVMLSIDRSVDVQKLFDIYNIAGELKFRLVVSTEAPKN